MIVHKLAMLLTGAFYVILALVDLAQAQDRAQEAGVDRLKGDGEICLQGRGPRGGGAVMLEAYCRRALSHENWAKAERAALLTSRATALQRLNEGGAAIAALNEALTLNPASAQSYLVRGLLLRSTDPGAALMDLHSAVDLNPFFVDALAFRGWMHHQSGDIAAAQADYDRALAIRPRASLALFAKAVLYFQQGRVAGAEDLLQQVLALSPVQHPMAALWLVAARNLRGDDGSIRIGALQPYAWWWADGVWPAPLVQLWSGAASPQAVIEAMVPLDNNARAQGAFFLGQWYLAGGEAMAARRWFEKTKAWGQPHLFEVIASRPTLSD